MKWIKILILVIVSISFFLFIRSTDVDKVRSSLQQVGFKFFYLLLVTFVAYLSATIGWQYCLGKPGNKILLSKLFFIRHVGETAAVINPTGVFGGEAVKIMLLKNKGIKRQTVLVSVLIARLLMVVTQLVLFLIALFYLSAASTHNLKKSTGEILWISLGILSVSTLIWYATKAGWPSKFIQVIKLPVKLEQYAIKLKIRLIDCRQAFYQFLKHNPKAVLWSAVFFTIHWLLGSLEFYFILTFLGIKTTVAKALLIDMGVIFFKAAGSFIPGQIGIEEYGNKVMLSIVGITDSEVWLTASVLRRARQIFWIAFGVISYLFINRKLLSDKDLSIQHQ